jgi:hypothetical protein
MTLLRLSMALYGILALASGLLAMLFPGPLAALGETQSNTFLLGSWGWLTALIGLGVLLASRDPIRHILWLRLALTSFLVGGVYDLFHYAAGTVSLGAILLDLAAYLLFGSLFLLSYPRTPRMVPLNIRAAQGLLYTDADQGGLFLQPNGAYVTYFLPVADPAQPPPVADHPDITEPDADSAPGIPVSPSLTDDAEDRP